MHLIDTTTLVHQIGWSLIHSIWLDLLVGLLLAASLKLLSAARPQVRYFISCAALVAMVFLPVITAYLLHIHQTDPLDFVTEDDSATVVSIDPNRQNTRRNQDETSAGAAQEANWISRTITETVNISAKVEQVLPWLIVSWLLGVVIYSIRLGNGLLGTASLRKLRAHVFNPELEYLVNQLTSRLSIRRNIKIFESSLISIPITIGWIYPLILVPPSSLLGLTPFQLQAIISHELIHIKRYDFLINFLQSVVEILLFYHPAALWTSRKIREEREYICDDLTLALCQDSVGYARALTKVARFQRQAEKLAIAATDGKLKGRIYRFVSKSQDPGAGKRSVFPNGLAIGMILLLLTLMFGGLNVLSSRSESAVTKTLAAIGPEADATGLENNLTGQYEDDLSNEQPGFRAAALQALDGQRGSVIIMNPRTGEIYSMVNQDLAFRRPLSAGSTFKMITSLAGIEESQVKESSKGFGYDASRRNLTDALAFYNNDYFKLLGQNLGGDTLIKYSKQFGFGKRTGINLPGEIDGYVPTEIDPGRSDLTGVTGGDIQVTPLQLAVFTSAVFNGGKIMVPQTADGRGMIAARVRGDLSVSESSVRELKKGLLAAIETGTGKGARQESYEVSGKTGSIANKESKTGLFVSYGVNQNAEYVVVVLLEGEKAIGAAAAKIAGKIYRSIG